jgi:pimeloyl-ACP methyl ester carboxylesterase
MNITRLASLAALAIAGATTTAHAAPARCADLRSFMPPRQDVVIENAREMPADAAAGLPAYCRVDGVIGARTGRNGKHYGVGFAVALPADWNGRFLFQGGGGLNGSVQPPLGGAYAGDRPALARGFAVASTDSGHKGEVFDASFFEDQQAALDFLYQGVPAATAVAKQIVERSYAQPIRHSYFVGCSTGGREAMMMSQRFPALFDGIVACAPAMRTSFSNLGLRHATAALNAIAPKRADGQPDTRQALSDADRALLVDGVIAACDALDGSRDGFLFAAPACAYDPGALECHGAKNERCLSPAQVNAVRTIMRGPRSSAGRQVYPGYFYDTGIANTQGLPGILAGPVIPEGGPVGTTFDIDKEWAAAITARSMAGDTDAWTNLSTYRARGGKLIFAHGLSDPWFSAQDTVRYYEQLGADDPEAPLADWSRLFLVPGMGHCAGGARTLDRFDLLTAIVEWVESAHAPERVIATGKSAPGESRPLCPWPAFAHYTGTGDAKDAANYACTR